MSEIKIEEPTEITTQKKYFLFKCGPTGSGKSTIESVLDTYLLTHSEINSKIFTSTNTINLSIDDLVERNPYFKENIDILFNKLLKNKTKQIKRDLKTDPKVSDLKSRKDKTKTIDTILNEKIVKIVINMFENPTQDIVDELNQIYENARTRTNCINGETTKILTRKSVKELKDSCENIRDKLLQQALNENKNIVFERTGKDFPKKLFDKFPKLQEYNIIFCWSVVNVCELLYRNKERVIVKLEKYLKIKNNSPIKYANIGEFLNSSILDLPRLPNTDEISYKKALFDIINTFNIYFYKKDNYRQIVIDNNYEPIIIYDNKYNNPTDKSNPMTRYNIDQYCNI